MNQALRQLPAATARRGAAHAQAMLLALGRHTLSGCLTTQGRQQLDWSADYRAYSAARLDPQQLFAAVLQQAVAAWPAPRRVWVAVDDSTLRKSGRRIPRTGWRRDPLSPPFTVNLHWGHRLLQSSLLWPASDGTARALPVALTLLPNHLTKKARAQLTAEAVREAKRQANVNEVAVRQLQGLAPTVRSAVVAAVDGRFANRTFLRQLPPHWQAVARIRKDACLYYPPPAVPTGGRPRLYGTAAPRPEQLLGDQSQPFQTVRVHAAGRDHELKLKTLSPLRSCLSGGSDGRLIVIAPLGYRLRRGGKLLYRRPAFLWVTDRNLTVAEAVQGYIWRWEEEVNFRDEKTLLGVGQAQVRHPESVARVPAWQVAAYSALLWCAHQSDRSTDQQLPWPKWRRQHAPIRTSTARLINQLRYDAWASAIQPQTLQAFWNESAADQKPEKVVATLPSAVFNAIN